MSGPVEGAAVRGAEGPVEVLFVGGMPRSGSTLFDLMVGQLPDHCDVGELFYLWQAGPLRDQLCACGETFHACPFWTAVGERAFGGWSRVDVADVLALQRRVDSTARLPLHRLDRLLPGHRRAVARYLDLVTALYRAIAEVSGAAVVVDSTKRPSTAYLLADDPRLRMTVGHVVRDPRGVLNSWSREVALPQNAGPRAFLKRRRMSQIVRRWVTVNAMIGRLGRRLPLHRVRYEDLVSDPAEQMRGVLALRGREEAAGDLDFLTPDGLRTGHSHAVAGGRVRFTTGPMVLRLDEAWRRELPGWKARVTALVCRTQMRRYGYQ